MNSDVQLAIDKSIQWSDLPTNIKQSLGNSQKEYEKCIISYSINNQLRYRENLIKFVYKDEKKYYEELLTYSRDNLMLYPYHLADVIIKGLRVTPFQYYISIIESMMDHDKSYDSIPNFTAIDCLRLLGIGRNEYIELMNQCRSGKKLFRRKSISKNLLPVKPIDIHIEPWWLVETGYITDEDVKMISEAEKALIDSIIDHGKQKAGKLDYNLVCSLYKKGLVYLEVPIEDDDHIVVLTLEGFVMNRVLGDYLEKLLYKILVSIDERTSVKELAALLQRDIKSVKNAVSLFCRLNLAKKKGVNETAHYTWSEVNNSPIADSKIENHVILDDPLLKELNEALAETSTLFKDEEENVISEKSYEIMDNSPSSQKRIAFFFDSTLTAFLMMGNLSPDLKKHAVKMFEAGKLTNEDLDEFLNELKNVSSVRDESEGEAKRYFDHALILRETVLALRCNSTKLIDLIRCESLQSLDQEIDRFLEKNYSLLVSMAPLSKEVRPITCSTLPHLGPPDLAVNSIWFKLFLYETIGCGPPSMLFPRGTRVKKIPKMFRNNCDKVLITSWGHEPASLPLSNMLYALNDALLYTPVLVQNYGKDDQLLSNTCIIPFPLKEDLVSECGVKWSAHNGIKMLNDVFSLNNSCGYITMLRTDNHSACKKHSCNDSKNGLIQSKPSIEHPSDLPSNGMTSEESKVLLQQEIDDNRNFAKTQSPDLACDKELKNETKTSAPRRVKLPISSTSIPTVDDWCILDCIFGVPLFDSKLNSAICNAIVNEGLWLSDSLQALVEVNKTLSYNLTEFIRKHQALVKFEDELPISGDEVPWPANSLAFCNGKLWSWDQE